MHKEGNARNSHIKQIKGEKRSCPESLPITKVYKEAACPISVQLQLAVQSPDSRCYSLNYLINFKAIEQNGRITLKPNPFLGSTRPTLFCLHLSTTSWDHWVPPRIVITFSDVTSEKYGNCVFIDLNISAFDNNLSTI